jgi:hypothetical protein
MKEHKKIAICVVGIVIAALGVILYASRISWQTRLAFQGEWLLVNLSPSQRPLRLRLTVAPTSQASSWTFLWHRGHLVTLEDWPSPDGNRLSLHYALSPFGRLRFLDLSSTLRLTPVMNLSPEIRRAWHTRLHEERIPYEAIARYTLVEAAGQRTLYLRNAANEILLTLTAVPTPELTSSLSSP